MPRTKYGSGEKSTPHVLTPEEIEEAEKKLDEEIEADPSQSKDDDAG